MSTPAATVQTAALAALAGVGTFARTTRERATLVANGAAMPLILLYPHKEKTSYTTKEHITSTMEVYFCDLVPGPGDSDPAYFATSDRLFTLKNKLLAALYDMPLTAVAWSKSLVPHCRSPGFTI